MVKILQKDAKELRRVASRVPHEDISTSKIQGIIKDMRTALEGEEDGVAIAAPQIGENLRIFVISHRTFEMMNEGKNESKEIKTEKKIEIFEDKVFINPTITKISKEKDMMEEGCLSVRYLYGKVLRAKKATVEAIDEHGKKFTAGASGIMAQIFQHEIDHLDGVLFIDEAVDIEDIPPEKLNKGNLAKK